MSMHDLQGRLEDLQEQIKLLDAQAATTADKEQTDYTLKCLDSLQIAVEKKDEIFGIEPWHPLQGHGAVVSPGEYLLRLKDEDGEALPPYPAIMTFYNNGLTAEIDTILFLCGLQQFQQDDEQQVSINISAKSLHSADFIKSALGALEEMGLEPNKAERIIIEIHESTAEVMSQHVLELFRKFGAGFALDDLGMSMTDVFRLSEFETIADYVKIDRKSVCAEADEPHSLKHVMSFIRSLLPGTIVVAEGVKSAQHAKEIYDVFPDIEYVQGLYLPSRATFADEWEKLTTPVAMGT